MAVHSISSELSNALALSRCTDDPPGILAALYAANTRSRPRRWAGIRRYGRNAFATLFRRQGGGVLGTVGDSRIYVCAMAGCARLVATIHRWAGCARRERSAKRRPPPSVAQPNRSEPRRPEQSVPARLRNREDPAGDVYLLCSDGLSDGLWTARLRRFWPGSIRWRTSGPPSSARWSRQTSVGADNITAVLALVEDVSAAERRPAGKKWLAKVCQLIQRTPAAPPPTPVPPPVPSRPPAPPQPGEPADGLGH